MKRQREDEEEVDEKSGPHSRRCRVEENKEALMHISLPSDIWRLIGLKLDALSRTRFRAVCKSWLSLIPQPPWLMLAQSEEGQESGSDSEAIAAAYEEDSSDDSDEDAPSEEEQESSSNDGEEEEEEDENEEPINQNQQHHLPAPPPPPLDFFSLADQQIYHIDFPQLHGAQCVGSRGNWLITAHEDRTIRLLNPFSKQQLYLPPQSTFDDKLFQDNLFETPDDKHRDLCLWKVILSSSPADGRGCIAIANTSPRCVATIARLGDDKWTTVRGVTGYVEDVVFYKEQLYVITHIGLLFVCDTRDHLTPPRASLLSKAFPLGKGVHSVYDNGDCMNVGSLAVVESIYLVEWLGELLMVIRFIGVFVGMEYKTSKFKVYKFDFMKKKWDILKSLGEHSLFLGFNTSVSLRASNFFGSMKKNCIYFTDDFIAGGHRETHFAGGHDMGVFSLEDNTITPHFSGASTCFYSPPVWIIPT